MRDFVKGCTFVIGILGLLLGVSWGFSSGPQQQYIPTYSAKYSAGEDGYFRDIIIELRGIRSEIQALRRQQAPVAKLPASLAELVTLRCAGCHAEGVAEKKGAEFVLLAATGKVPPLSLKEKKRIMRQVTSGLMPPGAPLPEEEKDLLNSLLYPKEELP